MNRITKYRMKNPYFYIALISLFLVLMIFWAIVSEVPKIYFINSYDAPDFCGLSREKYLDIIMEGLLSWEGSWIYAFTYLVDYFPIFPTIVALGFSRELKGYYSHACNRLKNPRKELHFTCFRYAVAGGAAVSIALCGFCIALAPFVKAQVTHLNGFTEFFPKDFYPLHPFVVFIIMSCTIYFGIGFAFCYFATSIALWKNNAVFILALPFVLYNVEQYLSIFIDILPLKVRNCVVAFDSPYNPIEMMVPLLLIVGLSVILIELRLHCKKGWMLG